jgi:hypothetical protein
MKGAVLGSLVRSSVGIDDGKDVIEIGIEVDGFVGTSVTVGEVMTGAKLEAVTGETDNATVGAIEGVLNVKGIRVGSFVFLGIGCGNGDAVG